MQKVCIFTRAVLNGVSQLPTGKQEVLGVLEILHKAWEELGKLSLEVAKSGGLIFPIVH